METKGRGTNKKTEEKTHKKKGKQEGELKLKLNFIQYLGYVILCNSVV